jgi:hypothetical protein
MASYIRKIIRRLYGEDIAQKDAELAKRDEEIIQKDAEITRLMQLLSQRDAELAQNAIVLNDVTQELLSVKQELAQREMEAKRKEEEEAAALKMEQERELAIKEKKELDAVFSLFRDAPSTHSKESNVDYAFKNLDENECKFLRSLEESGETILAVNIIHNLGCAYDDYNHIKGKGTLEFVFTNYHYYKFTYTSFIKKDSTSTCKNATHLSYYADPNHHGCPPLNECYSLKTGIFYASKLYSFINPLNIVYAKLVLSFIKGNFNNFHNLKNLELILRLIPGSYKNGSWRQQDGIYFNETIMEVSALPPPDE